MSFTSGKIPDCLALRGQDMKYFPLRQWADFSGDVIPSISAVTSKEKSADSLHGHTKSLEPQNAQQCNASPGTAPEVNGVKRCNPVEILTHRSQNRRSPPVANVLKQTNGITKIKPRVQHS